MSVSDEGKPKRANKRTICGTTAMLMGIMLITQTEQITAFQPSTTITTKSWTVQGNSMTNNKSNNVLSERTITVSNFALSASASAAVASSTSTSNNAARAMISQSNLAVSLDRPLLSPVEYTYRAPSSKGVWSSFLAVLLSDVFKTALIAFILAVGVSLVPKLFSTVSVAGGSDDGGTAATSKSLLSTLTNRIMTPIQSLLSPSKNASKSKRKEAYSQPMPFEGDGGWGKCTLRSKKHIGQSFTIYEFALPKSYYKVPLALGQSLEFCCLSSNDDICTGSFYPYDEIGAGVVRVVLPNDKYDDEGNAQFMEILRNELRPGDEVAIKPGKTHLTYSGKHTPVTDMVYLASGLGIVPILDQIKAITPKGSSSVKVSSVTWFNNNRDDFDLAMDELEAEYMKHPTKLAVSCIMDDLTKNPLEGNKEVEEAVPYFNAGTMAVVCGPKSFAEKARGYLMRRGYPENCICVLP